MTDEMKATKSPGSTSLHPGTGAAGLPAHPDVPARLLIVEDEDNICRVLDEVLTDDGYEVDTVTTGEEGLKALEEEIYDVVLLDINLPGLSGMDVLSVAKSRQGDAQFIIMTAFGSVDTAVEAMKLGAFDYLRKPLRTNELKIVIRRALDTRHLLREVAGLRRDLPGTFNRLIVGRSGAMRRATDLVQRVAPTRANVLITGETGTGKELVARAVHDLSDRSRRSFVAVNCSALPESLLESELFGHVRGAFTGAVQSRRGLFEEAAGGTLFLDEISTISPAIQVKLLRVLQERAIKRVGGREAIQVDFRLLAATNADLSRLVSAGDFREDLFYRLNVFPIWVPPLRERKEDLPLLANHFRLRFAEENGLEPPGLSDETLARMAAYGWPGNIRELENFVERSVIMYPGARTIPFELPTGESATAEETVLAEATEGGWDLDHLEREYILRVLDQVQWHQGAAAKILGVNRRTLYRKIKRYREAGILPAVEA
jgi:two-component system NtrC family response regulator